MLKPEYLQRVPDGMIQLYAQAEMDILENMAVRIAHYGYWIPAVEHQAKMLEEAGMVREEILASRQGAAAADAGGRRGGTEIR